MYIVYMYNTLALCVVSGAQKNQEIEVLEM